MNSMERNGYILRVLRAPKRQNGHRELNLFKHPMEITKIQVLFACDNAYCINEKKAIKRLETFEYKPKKYAERVNHIFEVLGLSLFECYDMTEKLYKEVKKIATEINNFLNEGEFR